MPFSRTACGGRLVRDTAIASAVRPAYAELVIVELKEKRVGFLWRKRVFVGVVVSAFSAPGWETLPLGSLVAAPLALQVPRGDDAAPSEHSALS